MVIGRQEARLCISVIYIVLLMIAIANGLLHGEAQGFVVFDGSGMRLYMHVQRCPTDWQIQQAWA